MDTLSIVLLVFISILLLVIGFFFYKIFYKENKNNLDPECLKQISNDLLILKNQNLNIDKIKDYQLTIKDRQLNQDTDLKTIVKTLNNLEKVSQFQTENLNRETSKLSDEIKIINQVFTSNYKRGEFGEISLKWVLEECFNENEDIIIPQYTLKNGNRPDYFLKTNNGGIAIDSKFPFDNFVKIIKLKENTDEYNKEISLLKKHLKNHINNVSSKYISKIDDVEQVFLYLPSETLFSFIHSKRDLEDIRKYALSKHVIFTSSSTIPAVLRLIALFERDRKLKKNLSKIVESFKQILVESNRLKERWIKIDNKIETIVNNKKDFNISVQKLTNKIEKTVNSKIEPEILETKEKK